MGPRPPREQPRLLHAADATQWPVMGAPHWWPGMPESELPRLAEEQWGVLTAAQVNAAGVTARRVDGMVSSGRWTRLHRGIYLAQPGRREWHTRAVAALFAAGPGAALTHASAAYLLGLSQPAAAVELAIPHGRRIHRIEGARIRRIVDLDARVDERAWPWRTTIQHTVIDLAATVPLDEAVAVAARAVQRQLTSPRALRATLLDRPRHRWRRELAEALAVVIDGAESTMEVRFMRDVVRAHGLPSPALQRAPNPTRPWRSDAAFEDQEVLAELDGRLGHEGPGRTNDARRDRKTAGRGWVTIRAGWIDVAYTACELAADLDQVLQARGWRGSARPCRRSSCLLRARPVAVANSGPRGRRAHGSVIHR